MLRHQTSGKPVDAAEQATETALFAKGGSVELDNANHEIISGARSKLHEALEQSYGGLFRNNFWFSGLGLLGAIVATAAIMTAYGVSYGDNAQGIVVGISIPLIPTDDRRGGDSLRLAGRTAAAARCAC